MTMRPRTALLCLAAALLLAPRTGAAPPDTPLPPLPQNVVAMVEGHPLSFDAFCGVVVQHVQHTLKENMSGPRAILDKLVEEVLIRQWCTKYGIQVTDADVRAKEGDLSREVRRRSAGTQGLEDVLRSEGTSLLEFRMTLLHQLRKEAVANARLGGTLPKDENARLHQANLVTAKLVQQAKVEFGLPVVGHPTPVAMDPSHVARVGGEPITRQHFGKQLVIRLPDADVRDILDRECKIGVMTVQGVSLNEAALQEEIARMRRLWPLESSVLRRVIWTTVPFDQRFQAQFKQPVASIGNDRFHRGFFGLVRQMRATVTEAEIRAAYEVEVKDETGKVTVKRQNQFDPHLLVTDVKIGFQKSQEAFRRVVRVRKEALREARKILADASAGMPFSQIVSAVNARQPPDPTFTALKIRVYDSPDDRLIWDRVKNLRDGEVSSPIELIDSVHVMRRESTQPARTYAELKELLREFVARRKARERLTELIHDSKRVRIQWPLPQRGEILRRK